MMASASKIDQRINPRLDRETSLCDLALIDTMFDNKAKKVFVREVRHVVYQFGTHMAAAGFSVEFDRQLREVYWLDHGGDLNRLGVLPYLGGGGSPWIARVHINTTAVVWQSPSGPMKQRLADGFRFPPATRVQHEWPWQLELSVLPTELPWFPAWLAKLAEANSLSTVRSEPAPPDAPHGVKFHSSGHNYVWSPAAWAKADEWDTAQEQRRLQRQAARKLETPR